MSRPNHSEELCRLGAVIRERRKAAELSQEELAERIGCHRNYVGYVERGEHNVTYSMLQRFAAGFKCRLADLIRQAE